jgi:hypothetical protein
VPSLGARHQVDVRFCGVRQQHDCREPMACRLKATLGPEQGAPSRCVDTNTSTERPEGVSTSSLPPMRLLGGKPAS